MEIANNSFLTFESFVIETQISKEKCQEYIDIGWLQPNSENLFSSGDILKLRKAERICADFEIPSHAGAMIVDLLNKIDELENQVQQLRNNIKK